MDDVRFRRWQELQRDIEGIVKNLRAWGYKDGEIEQMMERYIKKEEDK